MKKIKILLQGIACAILLVNASQVEAKAPKEPPIDVLERKLKPPSKKKDVSISKSSSKERKPPKSAPPKKGSDKASIEKHSSSESKSHHKSSSPYLAPAPAPEIQLPKPLTYGTWFLTGDITQTVNEKSTVFFDSPEASDGIIYEKEGFKFTQKGVYQVTFGITSRNKKTEFELQLSGKSLPGGRLIVVPDINLPYGTETLTLMFSAKAGDILRIVNVSGHHAKMGAEERNTAAAYISILQLR